MVLKANKMNNPKDNLAHDIKAYACGVPLSGESVELAQSYSICKQCYTIQRKIRDSGVELQAHMWLTHLKKVWN